MTWIGVIFHSLTFLPLELGDLESKDKVSVAPAAAGAADTRVKPAYLHCNPYNLITVVLIFRLTAVMTVKRKKDRNRNKTLMLIRRRRKRVVAVALVRRRNLSRRSLFLLPQSWHCLISFSARPLNPRSLHLRDLIRKISIRRKPRLRWTNAA